MRNSFVPKLFQLEVKRLIILMGLIATALLICQSVVLPYRNALRSLLTLDHDIIERKGDDFHINDSSTNLLNGDTGVEVPDNVNTSISVEPDMGRIGFKNGGNIHDAGIITRDWQNASGFEEGLNKITEFIGKGVLDDDFKLDEKLLTDHNSVEGTKTDKDEYILETDGKTRQGLSVEQISRPSGNIASDTNPKDFKSETIRNVRRVNTPLPLPLISSDNNSYLEHSALNANTSAASQVSLPNDHTSSEYNFTSATTARITKNKSCDTPPKLVTSIGEMNRILVRNHRASRSMVINDFSFSYQTWSVC